MAFTQPFTPAYGQNQNLSAGTTSATLTLANKGNRALRIVNKGPSDLFVFVSGSGSTRAATVNDFCIVSGQASIIGKSDGQDTITYITDGTAAAFKIQPGEGY